MCVSVVVRQAREEQTVAKICGLYIDDDTEKSFQFTVIDDETNEEIATTTVTLLPAGVDEAVDSIKKELNTEGYPEVDIHIYAC